MKLSPLYLTNNQQRENFVTHDRFKVFIQTQHDSFWVILSSLIAKSNIFIIFNII